MQVSLGAFYFLQKIKPMRQNEVAELLAATGNFSVPYVKALLAVRRTTARCAFCNANPYYSARTLFFGFGAKTSASAQLIQKPAGTEHFSTRVEFWRRT